jgi:hypothetical protein
MDLFEKSFFDGFSDGLEKVAAGKPPVTFWGKAKQIPEQFMKGIKGEGLKESWEGWRGARKKWQEAGTAGGAKTKAGKKSAEELKTLLRRGGRTVGSYGLAALPLVGTGYAVGKATE